MTTNSKEYQRKYYAEHKEKIQAYYREYNKRKKLEKARAEGNPRLFDMRKDYRTPTVQSFRDLSKKKSTYSKEYYAENRERILEQQKLARERRKRREKQRAYYMKNRKKILEQQRNYRRSIRQAYVQSQQPIGFVDRIVARFRNLFGCKN